MSALLTLTDIQELRNLRKQQLEDVAGELFGKVRNPTDVVAAISKAIDGNPYLPISVNLLQETIPQKDKRICDEIRGCLTRHIKEVYGGLFPGSRIMVVTYLDPSVFCYLLEYDV